MNQVVAMRWRDGLLMLRGAASLGLGLFLPAGTLLWPAAWVVLIIVIGGAAAIGARLARSDPALLAERRGRLWQRGQPLADKLFMLLFILLCGCWLVLMGLDAKRFHWSHHLPLTLHLLGTAGLLAAFWLIDRVMQQNSFAAPVVKLQPERRQVVVHTGLYAHVRHPMYSGMVIGFFSVPLLLGSLYGLAGGAVLTVLFAIRIGLEEGTLSRGLPGYTAYQRAVPYRLVPYVW